MKILISGGSGFIGKNLVSSLIKKKNIDILLIGRSFSHQDQKNIKIKILDLNDLNYDFNEIIKFNPDIFVHLAWEGIPDYSLELSKKNYLNSMRIINLLLKKTSCSKIISTGSCWEYNDGNIEGECNESYIVNPKKPFSIYKNKIFNEVFFLAKRKKVIFNWLRLFYVYGPNQKKGSIISTIINDIKNKRKLNINFPSNINDYIYIDDVIQIINQFIFNNISSGIYNVGSGVGIEIKKLIQKVNLKINGENTSINNILDGVDLKKRNQNFFAGKKKLIKYLKTFELTDIDLGLDKMINTK